MSRERRQTKETVERNADLVSGMLAGYDDAADELNQEKTESRAVRLGLAIVAVAILVFLGISTATWLLFLAWGR